MFLINFKTYPESSGENAKNLFKIIAGIANTTQVKFVVCPPVLDLQNIVELAKLTNVEVWAQHIDTEDPGQSTGWLTPEAAVTAGVKGVVLNHSEHKLALGVLSKSVVRCKNAGLSTLIFANSIKEAVAGKKLAPNYISYEPSELVGSTETSVSKAKPDVITKVVEKMGEMPVVIGAGVKDTNDVATALSLGAMGIAVSSAVILAENQAQTISALLQGFSSTQPAVIQNAVPSQAPQVQIPQAAQEPSMPSTSSQETQPAQPAYEPIQKDQNQ